MLVKKTCIEVQRKYSKNTKEVSKQSQKAKMRKNLKKNSNTKPLREKQVISEIIPKDNLSETAARRLLELKQALRVCQRSCSSDKEPAERLRVLTKGGIPVLRRPESRELRPQYRTKHKRNLSQSSKSPPRRGHCTIRLRQENRPATSTRHSNTTIFYRQLPHRRYRQNLRTAPSWAKTTHHASKIIRRCLHNGMAVKTR